MELEVPIDLLSIDVDSFDFHVLHAILRRGVLKARVLVIEHDSVMGRFPLSGPGSVYVQK